VFVSVCLLLAFRRAQADSLAGVERLLAAGEFRTAVAALKATPAPASSTARWHLLASKAYDGAGDPASAVHEAQEAIRLDPHNEGAHLQLAQVFLTRHTPLPAYEILSDALTLFPDSVLIRLGMGLALQDLQRYDEAARVLQECLRRKPDFPVAFDALATVYLDASRYDDLLSLSADYLRRKPDDYRGYYYLAATRTALGQDLSRTELMVEKAIQRNPKFAASYALLGKVRLKAGRAGDAIDPLMQAIQLRPNYSPAWLSLGNAYRKLGREEEAARAFAELRRLKEEERRPVYELQYHRGPAAAPTPAQK